MSNFKNFQAIIRALGNEWDSEVVYFSQTRDFYVASYMPNYPRQSNDDKTLMSRDGATIIK